MKSNNCQLKIHKHDLDSFNFFALIKTLYDLGQYSKKLFSFISTFAIISRF